MLGNDAGGNGVADFDHHNWDRGGRLLGRTGSRRSVGYDHIDVLANQLRGQFLETVNTSLGPAVLDDNVPSFYVAKAAQARPESPDASDPGLIGSSR